MTDKKIFVTGAGGFIGARVVEMGKKLGLDLIAGIRSNKGIPRLARMSVDLRKCDLLDIESLKKAFEGCPIVVHCAMSDGPSIIKGTRNVLQAAKECGVERVMFISTVDVYGHQEGDIDESTRPQKSGYWYNEAKIEAEKICEDFKESSMDITILRPAIVYGPFCKPWTLRYYDRLRYGRLGLLNDTFNGYCNAVYVDDVVRAVFAATEQPRGETGVYNVVGPELVNWNDYFRAFHQAVTGKIPAEAQGATEVRKENPIIGVIRSFAKYMMKRFPKLVTHCYSKIPVAKKMMKRTEIMLKCNPEASELALYQRKARYQSKALQCGLGFKPQVTLDEGMKRTSDYLKTYFE